MSVLDTGSAAPQKSTPRSPEKVVPSSESIIWASIHPCARPGHYVGSPSCHCLSMLLCGCPDEPNRAQIPPQPSLPAGGVALPSLPDSPGLPEFSIAGLWERVWSIAAQHQLLPSNFRLSKGSVISRKVPGAESRQGQCREHRLPVL